MPPKRFEGKFGIPPSHPVDSLLTSALYRLPESITPEYIERFTMDIVNKVNPLRAQQEREELRVPLTDSEIQTLKLKLSRRFEDNGESATINIPTCVDALVESPRFLQSDKGSIEKLFELHEVKTLQKIAELRKKRAEITGSTSREANPYENLFETASGSYYLARLLNMPHLESESIYMDHCVGTSTSYVNKMKRGEVEIFSFRIKETDMPLVTIEYDCKAHRLLQVKGIHDVIPTLIDAYVPELIDAIEKLSETTNDNGEKRTILSTEVPDMKQLLDVKDKHDKGEKLGPSELRFLYEIDRKIQCFDPGEQDPVIAQLLLQRKPHRSEDIATMCDCPREHIATDFLDITSTTRVFAEDTGTKITIVDFREEKYQAKLPVLIELVQKLNETGSPARPDMSFEGGIVPIDIDQEKLKSLKTALESYEIADNKSPSWIWNEWRKMESYRAPEAPHLDIIILSYNNDPETRQSSDKVVADMDRLNLRPATIAELIALGIAKPEFNKRNDTYLVGLGTKEVLGGGSLVPVLSWGDRGRYLGGSVWADVLGRYERFVCVRK